jgi:uncharacterized protein YbjT (DUF2867 family)
MKILVTDPTGHIGRLVVRELLAPEFSVRVIVRDAGRLPEEVRAQVEVIESSLEDAATLQDALAGVEALFLCLPVAVREKTAGRDFYEPLARIAARAIREAHTPRVVTVWASDKAITSDCWLGAGRQAMENILNQSGAAIRHLRHGFFDKNLAGYSALKQPTLPTATAVADVALRWLVRRDWSEIACVGVQATEEVCISPTAPATSGHRPGRCFWF